MKNPDHDVTLKEYYFVHCKVDGYKRGKRADEDNILFVLVGPFLVAVCAVGRERQNTKRALTH